MTRFLPIVWWLASAGVTALLFLSLSYTPEQAVALAVLFLPGMVAARYFIPQLSFHNRREGIRDSIYLTLAILCTQYFAIALGHTVLFPASEIPPLVANPLFIVLLLAAFILPEILLERRIEARRPYDTALHFISDRRRVTLDPAEILYIESNDDEVHLHTADGGIYRTKTRISQWEAQLDRRFQRIHRSYIVNMEHIEEVRPTRLRIGGTEIEISRKYKEEVRRRLGSEPSTESERA